MPTITLRVSEEDHELLTAMASFKHTSLSDLLRRYQREGLQRDAGRIELEVLTAEYEQRLADARGRLIELRQTLQQALEDATPPAPST